LRRHFDKTPTAPLLLRALILLSTQILVISDVVRRLQTRFDGRFNIRINFAPAGVERAFAQRELFFKMAANEFLRNCG
jgi:hypothetical protein